MAGLGGKQRWDALVGLRWTFGASVNDTVKTTRRHSWNKQTGWHRVEGKNRAGQDFCYIHQLGSDQGMAWVDGTAIEGDSLQKLLKRANSIWIKILISSRRARVRWCSARLIPPTAHRARRKSWPRRMWC